MAKTDEKPDSSTTTKTLDNEDIHLQETAATFDGAQVETFSSGGGSQIPFNYTVDPRTKLPTSSSKLTGMLKSISLVFFLDLSGKLFRLFTTTLLHEILATCYFREFRDFKKK